jgi:Ca-activated chloride channel family protein
MTLKEPIYLLALLIIPVGVLAARLARARRRRYAVRLPTAGTLAALLPRESAVSRFLPGTLLALAAAAMVVALAKPQVTVAEPVDKASVMLVVDASGSMDAQDVSPTRLDAAKSAVNSFIDKVPGSMQVGLMSFSSAVEGVQAPTTDHQLVRDSLSQIVADGGTATGDALEQALARVRAAGDKKTPAAILLLSDGMWSSGLDPTQVAQEAKTAGVPISTVALGTPDGVVTLAPGVTRAVPPDPETLAKIAQVSGGEAFTANDAGQLTNVYKKLGKQLGSKPVKREATAGAAGIGAVFLIAAMALMLRRRDRLT